MKLHKYAKFCYQEAKKQAEKQRLENVKLKEERGGLEHHVQDLERKLDRAKHFQTQPISGQLVRRGRTAGGPGLPVSTATTGVDAQTDGLDGAADDDDDAGFSLSNGVTTFPQSASAVYAADGFPEFSASSRSAPPTTSKAQAQPHLQQQQLQAHPSLNSTLSWQAVNALGSAGSSVARSQIVPGATVRTVGTAGPRASFGTSAAALASGYGLGAQVEDPIETVAATMDPLAQHAAAATAMRPRQLQLQQPMQPTAELRFGSVARAQTQAQPLYTGTLLQQNGSNRLVQAPLQTAFPNGVRSTAAGSNPQIKTMAGAASGRGPSQMVF